MKIVDHWLDGQKKRQSPNSGGPLSDPSLLVLHFTASGGEGPDDDVNYFMGKAARSSAHLVIGRNGEVAQIVPFDVRAWHAGKSVWRGRSNCNDFSIGIEIDNWGPLKKTQDGKFRSWTGHAVEPDRVTEMRHKHHTDMSFWETFPEKQLQAVREASVAILAAYPTIGEIVGHDDIAPGRKVDPGPAFPMRSFQAIAGGRGDTALTRTVIATSLNARGGAGFDFDVLGQFSKGAKLAILYDAPGAWAQVEGKLQSGLEVTAWVSDQYLR